MTPQSTPLLTQTSDVEQLSKMLGHLDDQSWQKLGLYQHFHQLLFITLLKQYPGPDKPTKESLTLQAKSDLDGPVQKLFELTASEHIDHLIDTQWLTFEDGLLLPSTERVELLLTQISLSSDGQQVYLTLDQPSTERADVIDLEPDIPTKRIKERTSLPYVDPLEHISQANESPFTIRRLDRILTSLDGFPLLKDRLAELIRMPRGEVEEVFSATDRLGLTRQEGEYIKLEFSGTKIARLPREERLKTLAVMASRLRREAKLAERRLSLSKDK